MRRAMVEKSGSQLSVRRQCELLGLNRNRLGGAESKGLGSEDLEMARRIDDVHLRFPEFGARRMSCWLQRQGWEGASRRRVSRVMRLMGLEAIYRHPRTSWPTTGAQTYPYLLRDREVLKPDEVWCADVTYIPMARGFAYLVAIMDWFSRYVLSWRLSNTLDADFCVECVEEALSTGSPGIFNSDQGPQFTSKDFTRQLIENNIRISMDGRGRVFDNIFIERLWRTVKYNNIYVHEYHTVSDARSGLREYFDLYNTQRLHQALGYMTPWEVYSGIPLPERASMEKTGGVIV